MSTPLPPSFIPPDALDPDAIAAQVRRYRALASEVAELQGEMKQIQELVDATVDTGWKLDVDGVTASKRAGNREFCKITAIGLMSDEQKAACKATVYVDKKIRETVTVAGLLEQCMIDKPDARPVVKLS